MIKLTEREEKRLGAIIDGLNIQLAAGGILPADKAKYLDEFLEAYSRYYAYLKEYVPKEEQIELDKQFMIMCQLVKLTFAEDLIKGYETHEREDK